jgi:hypothetical protein
MVNQIILDGIKQAVSRGQTLQQAMQSFFNAGYTKEEIQESARQFQVEQSRVPVQITQPQKIILPIVQKPVSVAKNPVLISQPAIQNSPQKFIPPQTIQRVSNYPTEAPIKKGVSLGIILVLAFFLLLLSGLLVATLLFKSQIISFFNGL